MYASIEQSLRLTFSSATGSCASGLLAKDGIYVDTIPRDSSAIYLFPGARVDVAVSCSCAAYPRPLVVKSGAVANAGGNGGAAGGGGGGANADGGGGTLTDIGSVNITEVDVLILSVAGARFLARPACRR